MTVPNFGEELEENCFHPVLPNSIFGISWSGFIESRRVVPVCNGRRKLFKTLFIVMWQTSNSLLNDVDCGCVCSVQDSWGIVTLMFAVEFTFIFTGKGVYLFTDILGRNKTYYLCRYSLMSGKKWCYTPEYWC